MSEFEFSVHTGDEGKAGWLRAPSGFPVCGFGATLTSDLAFAGGIGLTVSGLERTMQRFELAMRGHRAHV